MPNKDGSICCRENMSKILEVTLNKIHLRLLKGVCHEKGRCLLGLAEEKWGVGALAVPTQMSPQSPIAGNSLLLVSAAC